jgi:hypothetical protein
MPSVYPLRTVARALRERDSGLPMGGNIVADAPRGYYIDFREKAESPSWPPSWFPWPGYHRFMAIAQWGLGAYERYLCGEGEQWLAASLAAGEFLVDAQERSGRRKGGWLEPRAHPHTFNVPAPWISAMAQGECASLLVRLHREVGRDSFAAAAEVGLEPMRVDTGDGGVRALLSGGLFLEEYPTNPPSFVLNGGIFALWGCYDVAVGLGDGHARRLFDEGFDTLVRNLFRWDTGFWSKYDLYPHRIGNVASPFYHTLHINQLRALASIEPRPELEHIVGRFEAYRRSRTKLARALAHKVAFRLTVW